MTIGRLIMYIYLFVAITSKVICNTVPISEDLVDEYYTTTPKPNENSLPQDEKDAQAIKDSDRKEVVIAGILSYRDKIRRFAISEQMKTNTTICVTWATGTIIKKWHTQHYWVSKWYQPQQHTNSTNTFMDLCFGLLEDESVVIGQYLDNFFDAKDETWITIGMVLTKDIGTMITKFDEVHDRHSFEERRKSQRHPFENMLRVWVGYNRDPIDKGEPNKDDVKKDADALKAEYEHGDWHEKCRDQLELILMKKSIKYARAVIAEFETSMGHKKLEDIINDSVNSSIKLNHDLADAYSSLARYIKDKYIYIADILRKYSDGSDFWAAWVMCIAVVHPQEWPKVDQAFQKDHKGDSLTKFVLQKLTTDKVMAEMIAVIVDPKFKPTTFSGKPGQGGSLPISKPPPVPPTIPAPASPPPASG